MRKYRILYVIVLFTVLAGLQSCAVGPNYKKPVTENPETFRFVSKSQDSIINLKWWEIFNDPTLDTLIKSALKQNKNLLIAASRVEQARANLGYNNADFGPKFGVNANASRGDVLQGIRFDEARSNFSTNAIVNWELDFWGKYRRSSEAAKAELLASFYGKRAVEIALISEVANNYFQLLDFKTRLKISENTLALRDSTLQIIQNRFDHGYTHIIDVNQAQIQKAITQISIPSFKRQIAFVEHNLSVLLGKTPDSIETIIELSAYDLPDSIPEGIPSSLLQRRPDILQSEQLYRAQNARIGVAQAMRFPSISLTGLLGLGSGELSNLVSNGLGWSVGAGLTGPLFEWGKNVRRVDIEREKARQSLLTYENTVLNAFLEVENALIQLSTLKDELKANNDMMLAASNASYLSRQRYYQGVTSYLEVIENQRQEFDAKLDYAENYQRYLNAYVNLYKSLGGGWISPDEIEKYAAQKAEDENRNINEIDRDSLYYQGQIVDLNLTKAQKKQRKEERKAQNKKDRASRKNARNNK